MATIRNLIEGAVIIGLMTSCTRLPVNNTVAETPEIKPRAKATATFDPHEPDLPVGSMKIVNVVTERKIYKDPLNIPVVNNIGDEMMVVWEGEYCFSEDVSIVDDGSLICDGTIITIRGKDQTSSAGDVIDCVDIIGMRRMTCIPVSVTHRIVIDLPTPTPVPLDKSLY